METTTIVTAIQTASASLLADSGPIITSGIGIGVVFFGAKLLWSKFKSMAR